MTLLSKLRPLIKAVTYGQKTGFEVIQRQMSEHRVFKLQPSRWQWRKFKDLIHLYFQIGFVPCLLFVGYQNLFTGPATIAEIPEDYIPKYWEYYKNPVTRLLARYIYTDPQQDYEKYCCYLFVEQEKIKLRELEQAILKKMAERNDYQAYYYKPVPGKYYRAIKEQSDAVIDLEDPISKGPI